MTHRPTSSCDHIFELLESAPLRCLRSIRVPRRTNPRQIDLIITLNRHRIAVTINLGVSARLHTNRLSQAFELEGVLIALKISLLHLVLLLRKQIIPSAQVPRRPESSAAAEGWTKRCPNGNTYRYLICTITTRFGIV